MPGDLLVLADLIRAQHEPFEVAHETEDQDVRLSLTKNIICNLPKTHLCVLKTIMSFFQKVVANSACNKMTSTNIALVFGPNMMRPRSEETAQFLQDTKLGSALVKLMIENYHYFFDGLEFSDCTSTHHSFYDFHYRTQQYCCCCAKPLKQLNIKGGFQSNKCSRCELNSHQGCLHFVKANFPCVSPLQKDTSLTLSCQAQSKTTGASAVVVHMREGEVWNEIGRTAAAPCKAAMWFHAPVVIFSNCKETVEELHSAPLLFELWHWPCEPYGGIENSVLLGSATSDISHLMEQKVVALPINEGVITVECEVKRFLIKSGSVNLQCSLTLTDVVVENFFLTCRTPFSRDVAFKSETVVQGKPQHWNLAVDVVRTCQGDLSCALIFSLYSSRAFTSKLIGVGTLTLRDVLYYKKGGAEDLPVPLYNPHHMNRVGKLTVVPTSQDVYGLPHHFFYEMNTTYGNGRVSENFVSTQQTSSSSFHALPSSSDTTSPRTIRSATLPSGNFTGTPTPNPTIGTPQAVVTPSATPPEDVSDDDSHNDDSFDEGPPTSAPQVVLQTAPEATTKVRSLAATQQAVQAEIAQLRLAQQEFQLALERTRRQQQLLRERIAVLPFVQEQS
eukprot:TRINITY_DN2583_c0_g1_i5.p1 TRINITY_DN2583_c0_g1~~TRINITY_DN2583_c0_g1_i5.p1  ORF type:complete len:616 (+),score=105.45 TRINITY_DN2583_c0_g1_i5:326-2173(+)